MYLIVGLVLLFLAIAAFIVMRNRRGVDSDDDIYFEQSDDHSVAHVDRVPSVASSTDEPPQEDEISIEKTFQLSDSGWESGQSTEVSVSQVDDLTEYKVYKQFGYYDKAAASLNGYLLLQDVKPKELVFELCGMYLESGDLDNFVQALDVYNDQFATDELEEVVKMGFEVEPNNLALRVFAEEKFGWDPDKIAQDIVKEDGLHIHMFEEDHHDEAVVDDNPEEITNNFQAAKKEDMAVAASKAGGVRRIRGSRRLVQGFERIFDITPDERETIIAFSSGEKVVRLLSKELDYHSMNGLYNRVITSSKRPANVIIDALDTDFSNGNIVNYADHLWGLYSVLGKYGRQVKEKMLGWGYTLGEHPVFSELEESPDEVSLKNIGVKYGYIEGRASAVKSKMLPLVTEDIPVSGGYSTDEVGGILQTAEAQLMYGQVDEAISTLEDGVDKFSQESQLYTVLLDLYERSESWKRFEDFDIKVRSSGIELPHETAVAISNLRQKMNERRA